MIQRLQTLFFFFSSISILVIIYKFPVLQESNNLTYYFLKDSYYILRWLLFISIGLSLFGIFQYRNIKRQKIIAMIARFLITLVLVLLVFVFRNEEQYISIGTFLLLIPFLSLIIVNLLLRRDERIINSADRIR